MVSKISNYDIFQIWTRKTLNKSRVSITQQHRQIQRREIQNHQKQVLPHQFLVSYLHLSQQLTVKACFMKKVMWFALILDDGNGFFHNLFINEIFGDKYLWLKFKILDLIIFLWFSEILVDGTFFTDTVFIYFHFLADPKKHSCNAGKIIYNATLRLGMHSGMFTKLGRVSTMDDCIERCCKSSNADVAYKLGSFCFAVKCKTREMCKPSPTMFSDITSLNLNPAISFLNQDKMPLSVVGKYRQFLFCSSISKIDALKIEDKDFPRILTTELYKPWQKVSQPRPTKIFDWSFWNFVPKG